MIWLLTRVVVVPFKATTGGFKLGFWTGRVVGWRRIALVGAGVGIGVLIAPGPGAELRDRLRERFAGGEPPWMGAPPRPATDHVTVPPPVAPSPVPPSPPGRQPGEDAVAPIPALATTVALAPEASSPTDSSAGSSDGPGEVDADVLPAVPDADPAVTDQQS